MPQLPYYYGTKVRIFPSNSQKRLIKKNSDASRFIYNQMAGINQELYFLRQVKIPIKIVQKRIDTLEERLRNPATGISNIHGWLNDKELDSLMKANAIRNYRSAWSMFYKVHNTGIPVFHKKGIEQKYQTSCMYAGKLPITNMNNGNVRLLNNRYIHLPKLGNIRFKGMPKKLLSRKENIRIGTTTVSMDSTGCYYISLQLASEQPFVTVLNINNSSPIGIDLNTDNFITDSDGNTIDNPRYYRSIKGKLAKAQQKLSRRALRAKREHRSLCDSKNYQEQRKIVATIQRRVTNCRKNFLHNVSTTLIKNHDLVVAEELRSKNMLQNHALAMSIADVGWKIFLNMLTYKAELYGQKFITISPYNTTQKCSNCAFVMRGNQKLTLADRKWTCPKCCMHHIRDHNAAKNILNKGLILN